MTVMELNEKPVREKEQKKSQHSLKLNSIFIMIYVWVKEFSRDIRKYLN
jgi:hypothetical protein